MNLTASVTLLCHFAKLENGGGLSRNACTRLIVQATSSFTQGRIDPGKQYRQALQAIRYYKCSTSIDAPAHLRIVDTAAWIESR